MNVIERPPEDVAGFGPADREIDALLHAYFQAEMPRPWPKPPLAVASAKRVARSRWSLVRSRWTLAASIALLLLCQLWLASRYQPEAGAPIVTTAEDEATNRLGQHSKSQGRPGTAAYLGSSGP
jgi:hypothetical protein